MWGAGRGFLAGLAVVAAAVFPGIRPAWATETPAFSPVQTERETSFVSRDLGLADHLAAWKAKLGRPIRVDYAMIDLDGDGQGEIVIRILAGEECSPGTCETLVFNLAQGRWVPVLQTMEPQVTIAKQTHRGYRDILVGSQPWLWGGKAYRPAP
jgi:hypothetical protein